MNASRIVRCALAVCAVLGAPAAVATAAQPAPQSGEVQAYAEASGLSLQAAASRLELTGRAHDLVPALQSALGARYAGLWLGDDGRLKVGITAKADAAAAAPALTARSLSAAADFVPVTYTWAQLAAAQRSLEDELGAQMRAHLLETSLDPVHNEVNLTVSTSASPTTTGAIRSAANRAGVSVNVLSAPPSDFAVEPAVCSFPNCSTPLRGGVEMDDFTLSTACSMGFLALSSSPSDTNRYIVTAGHCFENGTAGTWVATSAADNLQHPIGGWFNSFLGSAGDMAIIRVADNSPWNITGWAPEYALWGINESDPLHGVGSSFVNMPVCHAGARGGTQCGTVQALNVGITLSGLESFGIVHETQTSACGVPGDSGGPVVESNIGYGVFSATTSPCPGGGIGYYTELSAVNSVLGIREATQ